jgi:hypothetical protein
LPYSFGGDCRCPGGCELSDAGPWQDPQWNGEGVKAAKPDESSTATTGSTEPIAPPPPPTEAGVPHGETMPAA